MKKLLVVVLVLSMASMASATLQLSVGGDTSVTAVTVAPSDHLSLDITTIDAIPVNASFNWLLVATLGGTIPVEGGVVLSSDAQIKFEMGGNAHWYLGDSSGILPADEEGRGGYIVAIDGAVPAGTKLFDQMDFHCDGPGAVLIKLYTVNDNFDQLTLVDSVAVTQTPEPMTMALLGLGGLFLRRRSK